MSARDTELDSFVTAFVQNSLSQAKQMVGEAMQVCSSPNGNSQLLCNQRYHCISTHYAADVLLHRLNLGKKEDVHQIKHRIAWNLKLLLVMANFHPA
jgi:hypothetical protein